MGTILRRLSRIWRGGLRYNYFNEGNCCIDLLIVSTEGICASIRSSRCSMGTILRRLSRTWRGELLYRSAFILARPNDLCFLLCDQFKRGLLPLRWNVANKLRIPHLTRFKSSFTES